MGRPWSSHEQEMGAGQAMGRSWAGDGCRAYHGQVMGKSWASGGQVFGVIDGTWGREIVGS